jgi:hypothetical protein
MSKDKKILEATVKNVVTITWQPGFAHTWLRNGGLGHDRKRWRDTAQREGQIILDYLFKIENFLPANRGFEESYHYYLYGPVLTFFLPLSNGH